MEQQSQIALNLAWEQRFYKIIKVAENFRENVLGFWFLAIGWRYGQWNYFWSHVWSRSYIQRIILSFSFIFKPVFSNWRCTWTLAWYWRIADNWIWKFFGQSSQDYTEEKLNVHFIVSLLSSWNRVNNVLNQIKLYLIL